MLVGFQQMGHELREQVASSLTAGIELLLHAPYYTYARSHVHI